MHYKQPIIVAMIMGKLWAGGVEAVIFNYYRELDHSKVQFDFFYDADSTVDPPKDIIDMGARFIKIPPYQDLRNYIRTLRYYFKKNHYLIIHSNINTLSVFPLYAAWREHIPVRIAHNHSVPGGSERKRNAAKNFLRLFSKLFATDYFACSEKAGRWLFGNRAFENGKVFVMKNAIDFSRYQQSEEEINDTRDKLNLNGKFVVGHVGRFTFAKNHSFLLDVFNEIHKKDKSAVLLLVGDGELHDEIEGKILSLNLQNSVVMTGKVSDPEKYYAVMDVLVLPSVFEGLSMTTVEAQAAGKNVVISRTIPEEAIISNGCYYMENESTASDWARKAVEVADRPITYTDKKNDYSIKSAARKLEDKYYLILNELK